MCIWCVFVFVNCVVVNVTEKGRHEKKEENKFPRSKDWKKKNDGFYRLKPHEMTKDGIE